MKKRLSLALLLSAALFNSPMLLAETTEKSFIEQGKELAFNRAKGNCLACHRMDDGISPGNIAPPLLAMQARFPDKEKLREQVYDATAANPHSMMPPFGKHGVLTNEEIDKIVAYLYTL